MRKGVGVWEGGGRGKGDEGESFVNVAKLQKRYKFCHVPHTQRTLEVL